MIVPCAAGLMVSASKSAAPRGGILPGLPRIRGRRTAAADGRSARGRPSQVLRVWCPHGFWMLFGRDWLPGADPGEETGPPTTRGAALTGRRSARAPAARLRDPRPRTGADPLLRGQGTARASPP